MTRISPYHHLVHAEFAGYRIERIFVKETLRQRIRFSDWRGGRHSPNPLVIAESELLVLLGDAIAARVFSTAFLRANTMPIGPKGEKRLADVIGNAVKIARIATGEEEDVLAPTPEEEGKDPGAVAMGKKGGAARAAAMTPQERAAVAKAAAEARWKK